MFKYLLLFLLITLNLFSQLEKSSEGSFFYFDSVVFKSDSADFAGRVDVFALVPYDRLKFINDNNKGFAAKYDLVVSITDSKNKKVFEEKIEKTIYEENYFVVQGGSAAFQLSSSIANIESGDYRLRVLLYDHVANQQYERARTINIVDYKRFDYSMSGIMLVSSIEETEGGKFKITPHISDNIGELQEQYFTFFEVYNETPHDSAHFVYRYIGEKSGKDEVLYSGDLITKALEPGLNRIFIPVRKPDNLTTGTYKLQIQSYRQNFAADTSETDIIAIAQRSVKLLATLSGFVFEDLDESIRQLRYVAYKDEMDYITNAPTESDKRKRFEEFWQKKDPSVGTRKNEAFEDYYSRVRFANENFRSYAQGWMTDMGMVFIIYGRPYNIDNRNNFADGRNYQVWRYTNGREFFFSDNSGFGDYRLVRPVSITEKYQYNR